MCIEIYIYIYIYIHMVSWPIDWRYLPYMRPKVQAYASRNIATKYGQTCITNVPQFWDPEIPAEHMHS